MKHKHIRAAANFSINSIAESPISVAMKRRLYSKADENELNEIFMYLDGEETFENMCYGKGK